MSKMIVPVIIQTPENKVRVQALVKHCKELDGTEVKVVEVDSFKFKPLYPDNALACKRGFLFHEAALAMKGETFLYLRFTSLPREAGWLGKAAKEYKDQGKPIVLVNDKSDDLVGVGIYPPEAHYLIPKDFKQGDMVDWMVKHLSPVCLKSHVVGSIFALNEPSAVGVAKINQNPVQRVVKRYLHTGDLGDCLAMLPTMRQLGGGHLFIGNHPKAGNGYYRPIKGEKYEAIRPLLEVQPYIHTVNYGEDRKYIDYDFSDFRSIYDARRSLAHTQALYVKIDSLDTSPWLIVNPSKESKGKVIIARSCRYHSRLFPWESIVEKYKDKLLFLGLPEEHKDFEKYIQSKVEYRKTKDFLEIASLIAGSKLLVSNQTSFTWLGLGLGHPMIQETFSGIPDSIIKRDNVQYCPGWDIDLPVI